MKTICGRKVKAVAEGWFYQGPSALYLNPAKASEFAQEFNLAGSSPERSNKRDMTDSWRRIGRSGRLAFVGKGEWEGEGFISADVYELAAGRGER